MAKQFYTIGPRSFRREDLNCVFCTKEQPGEQASSICSSEIVQILFKLFPISFVSTSSSFGGTNERTIGKRQIPIFPANLLGIFEAFLTLHVKAFSQSINRGRRFMTPTDGAFWKKKKLLFRADSFRESATLWPIRCNCRYRPTFYFFIETIKS